MIRKFQSLSPNAKMAWLLGGGTVLLVTGWMLATSSSKPSTGGGGTPNQNPNLPPIDLKPPYQTSYRGATATIGQAPDEPTRWICVYSINGREGAVSATTNEAGIVTRFHAIVDAELANGKWVLFDIAQGAPLLAGGAYRLSLPANSTVVFPIFSLPRERYTLSNLPADWDAADRSDPTRDRLAVFPTDVFQLPAVPGGLAWIWTTLPQA